MRTLPAAVVFAIAPCAGAQPVEGLAPYFGFETARTVVVDDGCGPVVAGDFNGDGRPDLAVANNAKSRIEMLFLRAAARTEEEVQRAAKANELPPSPWYDRELLSVSDRVTALRTLDIDGDGALDLLYAASQPDAIVALRQVSPGRFGPMARQRVRELGAPQEGLAVADVIGGDAPEVLALVGGKIAVYPLDRAGRLGEPTMLGSGGDIQSLFAADLDGDGRQDVAGVVPEDPAPLRVWLQSQDPRAKDKAGLLASELRFEMAALRAAAPVSFPKRAAASVGVIERASRRVVFYDLDRRAVSSGGGEAGEREMQAEVTAFPGGGDRDRPVLLLDVDGDGQTDVLTTDAKANAVVLFRQQKGIGLGVGRPFSAFKQPRMVDGERGSDGVTRVFVLSQEERAVGVSEFDAKAETLSFPRPVALATAGSTPVAMKYIPGDPARLAVAVKAGRDYTLEVHVVRGESAPLTASLKQLKRDPSAILPFDADRDGSADLLLLTPGESMVMARLEKKDGATSGAAVLDKDSMPQFGLVQSAGPANTALLDVDGDGFDELLIADANFVRACAYDRDKGWRVVDQVNVPDAATQLAGLSLLKAGDQTRIVASDKAGGRLLVFEPNQAGRWTIKDRIRLLGFPLGAVRAGSFSGDAQPGILALAEDSFAVVRLGGARPALSQLAAFRSESEDRLEHKFAAGDINGDGYQDAVVLDAKEQMCSILTFSAARKLHAATEFKVFESRLFSGGDTREFQPSDLLIADLTGDGKQDLALLVHNRVVIYPQATGEGGGKK